MPLSRGRPHHHVAKYYNYSARDFTTQLERYDVIFDAVDRSSFVICRLHLVPGGLFRDDAADAEPLFLERCSIDYRNFQQRETRKGHFGPAQREGYRFPRQIGKRRKA